MADRPTDMPLRGKPGASLNSISRPHVTQTSNPTMSENWPPILTIQTEPVLRLFTGENFYSSADVAIREVVLNCIDAIGRRNEADGVIEPQIQIVFDQDKESITISDNGDGMDREDLGNLFSKVGASASRLAQDKKNYRAIGEFGIGALSYFLVCKKYKIDTTKKDKDPICLFFSNTMLDGITRAEECVPTRTHTGTTVTMFIKSPDLFQLCKEKFSHWMRNVDGMYASVLPENEELTQGGLTRQVRSITLKESPDWIENTDIGPPEELDIWDSYDGKGHVDVLYRGVFVERLNIDQLWGLEGAIHVDPKRFRPKLDREGFVGDGLRDTLTPFLQSAHPLVLGKAIECIRELLNSRDDWSANKAITLWLAVPRHDQYSETAKLWDDVFRVQSAFRLLSQTSDRIVSISEIIKLGADKLYLAPDEIDRSNPVIGQAIRALRARGSVVVQGLKRDGGYMATVPVPSHYTSWLLRAFSVELPPIVQVQNVSEELVGQESVAEVYNEHPAVKLVKLGPATVPFVAVREEIWLNIETEGGKKILEEICRRNEGHLGLWVACMMHAPDEGQRLDQVGALLRQKTPPVQRLGLVQRQYLRSLLE